MSVSELFAQYTRVYLDKFTNGCDLVKGIHEQEIMFVL